ncbi:MAG: two-component regulator propeller domain-containing protein [Ferruginibacter sp.]
MKKLLFILLIFCSIVAKAQYKNPFFNTLTVEKGLPEGNIMSSLEDKSGYIWLGTQNGLVRYDGYQIKPYLLLNDEGKPSIRSSVNLLFEDAKQQLWVSIALEGMYHYNRQKDAFDKIKIDSAVWNIFKNCPVIHWIEDDQSGLQILNTFESPSGKPHVFTFDALQNKMRIFSANEKGSNFIPAYDAASLIKDGNKKIWLLTDSLINIFNPKTGSFDPYALRPNTNKNIMFYGVMADPENPDIIVFNSYFGGTANPDTTHKRAVYQFNTRTKEFRSYLHDAKVPGSIADECIHILIDSSKRIWCSTLKGVSLLNTQTGTFTNYALKLPPSTSDEQTHVESIAADKDGNLWLGGFFKGLFFLNVKTATATYYAHTNTEGSLPDHDGIKKLYFDHSGTLWLNVPYHGMAYLNRPRSLFNPFPIAPSLAETGGKLSLDDYFIYEKYGDSSFLLKDSSGLYLWNYNQNTFKSIDLKNSKIYKQIIAVYAAHDGKIWIGCAGAGLFCYNPFTKQVQQYKNDAKDSTSLGSNYINTLTEDPTGNIWIGTGDKGICCLNKQTGKFIRYPFIRNNGTIKPDNKLDDAIVASLYFDSEGIVWVGTNFGGLNRFDTRTNTFTSYLDAKQGLSSVISIFEDSHKRLWAGTYLSGLFLVDKKTGSFKRYGIEDGLLHSSIGGITEDKTGNIWTASARGLSRLDPTTNKITNFITYDGDQNFQGKGSPFFIGVKNGLITLDPDKMKTSNVPPVVLIESLGYHSAKENKDTLVFTHGRENIELKYNENKISFQYIAIHTGNAEANKYAYQLEGNDKDWIEAGTQRSVTYSNLSPGTYTFKVKACNSDAVWNENGASFAFTIQPPWWKTWWAYLLYAAIFIAGISSFIAYRSAALKKENKVLEEKVALRTTQLQSSITELKSTQTQLIQSEKMASLGELTAGIAHEIQNPLNFVNNFSEVNTELIVEMVDEVKKGNTEEALSIANDIKENEQKINHHGKRADAIVKGMLQHSRSSNGIKEPTDINALCDEYLRLSYHGLRAKDKSFNATLKTDFDDSIGKINIISQDIGRVILNLLTNAFYAVNEKNKLNVENYEPTVTIKTSQTPPLGGRGVEEVHITVTDNGNGIAQKVLEKIFQPFFTTKPTGQGTGLGLSLSYDIITKGHGGELRVNTQEGGGTTFIVILPIT